MLELAKLEIRIAEARELRTARQSIFLVKKRQIADLSTLSLECLSWEDQERIASIKSKLQREVDYLKKEIKYLKDEILSLEKERVLLFLDKREQEEVREAIAEDYNLKKEYLIVEGSREEGFKISFLLRSDMNVFDDTFKALKDAGLIPEWAFRNK